jgi:thioredoxin-like negative regulator of GroEL
LPGKVVELSDGSFDDVLNNTEYLLIVEFVTTTCPNCAAIAPVYAQLSVEMQKNASFIVINAEHSQKLATRYGVLGVPTFKFFCAGQPIGELVGAINETMLRNTIKDLIRHKNECVSKTTPLTHEMDGYG